MLLLLSVAALVAVHAIAQSAASEPTAAARIVFINSYHRGYSWSDAIERALRDELARSGRPIELSFEYLDSRRFGYGDQIPLIARTLAAKYRAYRPEVLVVCDNPAFEFAMQYREQLFPGVPLVFCGYNDFPPETARWLNNATGVTEATSIEDSVAMALKVHPGTHTLAFITSTANSTNAHRRGGGVRHLPATAPALRRRGNQGRPDGAHPPAAGRTAFFNPGVPGRPDERAHQRPGDQPR